MRRREAALGEVGEVLGAETRLLRAIITAGALPVVASVGLNDDGALLNINADEAAGAIAAARGGTLLLCTDVAGVQLDGRVLDQMNATVAERMLADGSASAGMRPKLRAALTAAAAGCRVLIVDGRAAADLAEALRGGAVGTMVTAA